MEQIVIKHATKEIKENLVLHDICLTLDQGGIYGFWGANGSGKTMLFRAIAGLIHLTSGEIHVFSQQIGKDVSFPESLGVVIESVGFWGEYTGYENLKLLASIKNQIGEKEIKAALERVGLNPEEKKTYKKYSLGMKQKLGIAQAIMEKPELIILDEPTNALDEASVQRVHAIIREEQERGATILIASHNKEDINLLCSRKFCMYEGALTEAEDI